MKNDSMHKTNEVHSIREVMHNSFPIVAIGASAGGLKAVTSLLENIPVDTGMAFIYVQHLSPTHKSVLPTLLAKITAMNVQEIENMEEMQANNVYVIPYNKIIEVTDGHIKLLPRPDNSSTISINVLFSSLAATHHHNVIGILLSGNGNDGTEGLIDIKNEGGLTFAQDDTAESGSMPQSAIEAGVVDFVLSPKEIAEELTLFSQNGFKKNQIVDEEDIFVDNEADLRAIFELLSKETGVDFSHYKMPTIKRRLNHKMLQYGIKTLSEYLALLIAKPSEVDVLHNDLLINVTSFFRDAGSFAYLQTKIFPKLLRSKNFGETLRI